MVSLVAASPLNDHPVLHERQQPSHTYNYDGPYPDPKGPSVFSCGSDPTGQDPHTLPSADDCKNAISKGDKHRFTEAVSRAFAPFPSTWLF